MQKTIRLIGIIFFALIIGAVNLKAQNKFEGYNIIVDATETQREATCAIRYVPPSTQVTIKDLNGNTPLNIKPCGDSGTRISNMSVATGTATFNAAIDGKWCFIGEDKMYQISFAGDSFTKNLTYNWIATPSQPGFYNVKDFGAVGDGMTDDTIAIKSALAYIGSRNGGTLNFPEGDYFIAGGGDPYFKGITLPTGAILVGAGRTITGGPTNNALKKGGTRITLAGPNRAIFRIGECTQGVSIRNMELYAISSVNTYGIEAVGAYLTSEGFLFEWIAFSNFYRGIYAHGLPITTENWQFDFIKVLNCHFIYNQDAGIWIDTRNTEWKISGCFFVNPKATQQVKGNSIYIFRAGAILIEHTYSGGFPTARGGDFITMIDGSLTVINSQCEAMTRSLVYGEATGAGNYSYPLNLIGNVFGDPIDITKRITVVSSGNLYYADSFRSVESVRIYSTGDRFCYDGYVLGCTKPAPQAGFVGGTVMFMTGQPTEGSVPGRPMVIGTDTEIKSNSPVNAQTDSSRPVLSLSSNNTQKPLLSLGDAQSGYKLTFDNRNWLMFQSGSPTQRKGYRFDAPVQLPNLRLTEFQNTQAGNGSMVFCTDCQRNSTPCRTGGNGSPAMFVNGTWECK